METILLIGHSRGLGKNIYEELSKDYNVIGMSSNELDLKSQDDVFNLKLPYKIDHLVYNSGMAYDDIITNLNLDSLNDMLNVNLIGAIIMTKHAIRNMLLHDVQGSITFVSSISAHTGFKGLSMYGASKGALESFSRGISREWGVKGIRSNCVAPSFMITDMTKSLSESDHERIIKRSSLKKMVSMNDVSKTIRYCIENKSLTGETIILDCGN